ncbi:MAG: hypothetical protein RLZZ338_2973, partial [Cyanobacteriota bacterium]
MTLERTAFIAVASKTSVGERPSLKYFDVFWVKFMSLQILEKHI